MGCAECWANGVSFRSVVGESAGRFEESVGFPVASGTFAQLAWLL